MFVLMMNIESFFAQTIATDWLDPFALGMENNMILDSQMAVSSQYSISIASNARLNLKTLRHNIDANTTKIVRYGGWIAAEDDNEPWFQVDFIANATVSAITTQSLDNGTMPSQITEYSVAFGYNMRDNLENYSIDGKLKVIMYHFLLIVSSVQRNIKPDFTVPTQPVGQGLFKTPRSDIFLNRARKWS